mgnify:CR=1 FL=1
MIKKNKIYARADEKFVKAVVLYANSTDKLFYDEAAKTDKVVAADLTDLFLKGVVIKKDNVYYRGICLKTNQIIGHDGTDQKTFGLA